MKTFMMAVIFFFGTGVGAQTVWQEQAVVEVVKAVEPLRVQLERDEQTLGEGAGLAAFLDGSLVRVKGKGPGAESWRYSVTYDAFQPVNEVYYLTLAEAQGLIRPDRNGFILTDAQARLMPQLELVAARLAFLESARAQIEERLEGRQLEQDYPDEQPLEDMRVGAALQRLSYERDRTLLECKRLKRSADLARLLACPKASSLAANR